MSCPKARKSRSRSSRSTRAARFACRCASSIRKPAKNSKTPARRANPAAIAVRAVTAATVAIVARVAVAVVTAIAVAVGFTDNRVEADAAATALDAAPPTHITLTGRIISDEGPVPPARSQDVTEMGRMSTAALLNLWHDADDLDVYRPYMTSAEAFGGLTAIDSPAPELASPVNWLNVFYAAEWVVFAGFAFYLWYRLAKDALEKETEALEDAAADAAAASGGTTA